MGPVVGINSENLETTAPFRYDRSSLSRIGYVSRFNVYASLPERFRRRHALERGRDNNCTVLDDGSTDDQIRPGTLFNVIAEYY